MKLIWCVKKWIRSHFISFCKYLDSELPHVYAISLSLSCILNIYESNRENVRFSFSWLTLRREATAMLKLNSAYQDSIKPRNSPICVRGPNTVPSPMTEQFHLRYLNWYWHSSMLTLTPWMTTAMWSLCRRQTLLWPAVSPGSFVQRRNFGENKFGWFDHFSKSRRPMVLKQREVYVRMIDSYWLIYNLNVFVGWLYLYCD